MSDIAIQVQGLSKQYRIGRAQARYQTFRDALVQVVSTPTRHLRGERREENTIWALDDVSFEVKHGEAVGIIGRNGAGKSTLLKILSRITRPTRGRVDLYGRVGSLLEVGTGFHPELTGRENIYLNGAILGMTRREINRKFDEIVDFAEIERFLDTPVKHYSSGMYVRLAFAVAAHLEPEILVVDEVLAVGDALFQKKCLAKMGEVTHERRTVLFVSHNMSAIKSLCKKTLLLQGGSIKKTGNTEHVIDFYLKESSSESVEWKAKDLASAPGNECAKLTSVRITDTKGTSISQVNINVPCVLEIEYEVLIENAVLNCSISIFSSDGAYVLASPSISDTNWSFQPHPVGRYRSQCLITNPLLNQGYYTFSALLVQNGNLVIAQLDQIVTLEVIDLGENRGGYYGPWGGVVRPMLQWNSQKIIPDNE